MVVVGAHAEFPPVIEFVRNEMPYQGSAAAMYDVLEAVNEICFFTSRNAPFLSLGLIESPVGSRCCRADLARSSATALPPNGFLSVEGKSGGRKATPQHFSMKKFTRILFRG